MTWKIFMALTPAAWGTAVILASAGAPVWTTASAAGAAVIMTWLLYRSVRRPLDAVSNGMYLLNEQDFSSRLRRTGQRDADRVVRLFNSLMDAMKAERLKLQEQTRLLTLLSDASPMGIAICDFDGHIVSRNPAYERLVTPAVERRLLEMAEEEVVTLTDESSQLLRCSRLWFMDTGFRRPFMLVEQMTDEIRRAERNLFNTIVRTIGHEVNNTMGSVASILDTLSQDITDPEAAEAIDSSRESCLNLGAFVSGYSAVVKLPAPELKETSLTSLAESLLPSLRAITAPSTDIILETTDDDDTTVAIDPVLIGRVIHNTVKNAAESIGNRPGGRITLKTGRRSLEITDNGPGISPEAAGHIFTPFFSTKRPDRGLGLMLCSEILRAHGARFSLATSPDDRLTRFTVRFRPQGASVRQ